MGTPKMATSSDTFVDLPSTNGENSYPPIVFDGEHFLISEQAFDKLPEYSASKPTGVFHVKCWKLYRDDWYIACYIEETPPHPNGMWTPVRRALVVSD